VALLLGNRSATLEALFAAARLGAIVVPLNTRLASPEIAEQLADCRPALLLYEAGLEPLALAACAAAGHAPAARLAVGGTPDAYEAALAAATPHRAVAPVAPEDPMILMYTSGTTGVPKGALLPHRKTLFNCRNAGAFFRLSREDRVLTVVPLFHSFGLAILALPTLWAGGRWCCCRASMQARCGVRWRRSASASWAGCRPCSARYSTPSIANARTFPRCASCSRRARRSRWT
jgi:fatty-acyl-CoA synthase